MTDVSERRTPRAIQALPSLAGGVVAVMALLVLLGWQFDVELLKSLLHPAHVAMNPTTAVAFLFSAVALWLQRREGQVSPKAQRVAVMLAALVLVTALGRLGAYLGIWGYRIDQLLFASRLNGNVMAPNTALAFALMSLALLMFDARPRRRVWPAQPLIIGTLLIATLSLVGYLYNVAALYGVRGAIPMALNTALLFLLLSVGALCARPSREPLAMALRPTLGGVVARRLLPSAFIVPVLVGGLLLLGWKAELYEPAFAMTLFTLVITLVFNVLIWWSARLIHQTDAGRQETVDALRVSEQRYHAIMRQTAEGIYLVDLDTYEIVETNKAMEKMLGYGPGELEGKTVFDLVDATREQITARLDALKVSGTSLQGERPYMRKDGSQIDVYAGATVISFSGRSLACTVIHDVTERNRVLRALQEKHDQLERAVSAERAAMNQLRLAQSRLVQSEKLASLGQMVAGVAHEINNPLAFVSNNVAVLERDTRGLCGLIALYARADELLRKQEPQLMEEIADLSERMDLTYTQSNLASMLTRSRDGLRRIQQIVKDLRDFARLDESDIHDVDLNAGIESTVNIVVGRAKKKQVELKLELQPLPLVSCFPAKINQVVMNLVANAIDACPQGGRVNISTRRENDAVLIEVADNGTGVPPPDRDRIFDPFFTTKPQGEGTGLGLSISYGIVHDHGGDIDVTDAPGGGAVFTVRLPIRAIAIRSEQAVPDAQPQGLMK